MTIQDALERAKQLQKARKDAAVHRPERSPPSPGRTESLLSLPQEVRPELAGNESYPDLVRVDFDAAACIRNHVLVSDKQMAEDGQAAAAFRLLRGRVLHRAKSGGWFCVGIASPGPGEGKTVTALNLAISIARERQRPVYLLDLDMRNASVLERVGVRPPIELSRYFTETIEPDRVLFSTSVDGLVIAGNRNNVPSASELLASARMDNLLSYIRRRSNGALVLVDLPPVLSTDEALVVAPRTDAMFLVVAEGQTRRDGLSKAIDLLSDFNVAGLILNRSSEKMGADYYSS